MLLEIFKNNYFSLFILENNSVTIRMQCHTINLSLIIIHKIRMQIDKNDKKKFKNVTTMLNVKKKSVLRTFLDCTDIQNDDARLGERYEASRFIEAEAVS